MKADQPNLQSPMSDNVGGNANLQDIVPAGDDHVVPFRAEGLDVRGSAVQLGPMLNAILSGHNYPEPVSRLLAEAICLSVLLGSSLKFDGRFVIQTDSDGPVSLIVVDYTTPNGVRAYARFDQARLDQLSTQGIVDSRALMGKGVLAMTIDQGSKTLPYQGIVALDGQNLEDVAHQYFRQSEQIPSKVRLGVAQLVESDEKGGVRHTWRAGGVIAQFLPDAPERMRNPDLPGGDDPLAHHYGASGDENHIHMPDDAWVEAQSLVSTIQDDELTDPQIGVENLLFRLFHQRGVHIYRPSGMINKCGCSRQKIVAIIGGFSPAEREEAYIASNKVDTISSKCEFCGKQYHVTRQEIGE